MYQMTYHCSNQAVLAHHHCFISIAIAHEEIIPTTLAR